MTKLFAAVDTHKTISRAKRKLKEYPMWREVAHDRGQQKVTQTYSFELRQPHAKPSSPVEKLAINLVDATAELDAIESAVNAILSPTKRFILHDKFLQTEPRYDFEIYTDLGYEKSRYYELLDLSLLSFANAYRNGVLVVYEME